VVSTSRPCALVRPPFELSRRLALPLAIQNWSLTSLQQRLFKTGGRLIRHARYFTLQLAESYLTGPLFRQIVARIERFAWHPQ